jgi:hypothetical protein
MVGFTETTKEAAVKILMKIRQQNDSMIFGAQGGSSQDGKHGLYAPVGFLVGLKVEMG